MQTATNIRSIELFTRFFQENQSRFFSFAFSYIKEKTKAEDILMESMAVLWENRAKWEEESNLQALLLTIIRNKALNHLKHEEVRLRAEEQINMHQQRELDLRISTLQSCDPDAIFNSEIEQIVNKTLSQISAQRRQIFLLSRYQHTSNKKIAEQLGISIKAVEFHISKTLKLLRVNLKDYLRSILF